MKAEKRIRQMECRISRQLDRLQGDLLNAIALAGGVLTGYTLVLVLLFS